jgi:RNA polymerase sigma-70 factor, ECF subfamily
VTNDAPRLRLAAAAAAEDAALEALVCAHHDRVYRFGLRVCRDAFDADDAVQEAFSKLAHNRHLQAQPGVLFWLMSVVKNACRRMLRPFARERRHLGERLNDTPEIASTELDPQSALERFELVRAVHAAIASLERPYREVLILRDLEGLTGPETCQALGLELPAMKTRLHRARSQLRERITAATAPRKASAHVR